MNVDLIDKIKRELEFETKERASEILELRRKLTSNPDSILELKLLDLKNHDVTLEIFSQALSCNIFLCPNEGIASQIRKEDPNASTYTVDEIQRFLELGISTEDLKRIHQAKEIFPGSRIIETKSREELLREALSKVNKFHPPGLYDYLKENKEGLYQHMLKLERYIDRAILIKSTKVLRLKLKEYRDLHIQAIREFKKSKETRLTNKTN